MRHARDIYDQLKERRVIRSAVVYGALAWGALQVVDLLAEAGFLSEGLVRLLIIGALVGFPLTLVWSWFFEAPWRRRKGLSVAGDVVVILAIAGGVLLLAWQQYFVSFARPVLAITAIEATDARPDSKAFGSYLAGRLRMVLATRPELAVTELTSSLRGELTRLGVGDRARALIADYVLAGTLNQRGDLLRVNLQLHDDSGQLIWSGGFEDRLVDLTELEGRILEAVWTQLPLPIGGLPVVRSSAANCDYPPSAEAIRYLVQVENGQLEAKLAVDVLTRMIAAYEDDGLLHRARAHAYFVQRDDAIPPRKPIFNNLGLEDLRQLSDRCPAYRDTALLRLHNTGMAPVARDELERQLMEFPNEAELLIALAEAWRRDEDLQKSTAAALEASRIDPLNLHTVCRAAGVFREAGDSDLAEQVTSHLASLLPEAEAFCEERSDAVLNF